MITEKELREQAEILRDLCVKYLLEVQQEPDEDIAQQYAVNKAMAEYEFNHRYLLPYGGSIQFMIDSINGKVFFATKFSPIIEVDFFDDFKLS